MALKESIERFAKEQGWVVKYANDGTPNFFQPIYRCKSSDLDPSLPDHTHPAFVINGQEIDRRLIAVYKGGNFNGAAHSIPNVEPLVNLGADQLLSRIKNCGDGFGPKTVADSGLLLLLAKKLGKSTIRGNNQYGADYREGTRWAENQNVTVGLERVWNGILYSALTAHTSSEAHRPDRDPVYWIAVRRVGGVMASNGVNTLTGSGPVSWRFGGVASGIDDLTGNCYDQDYGYRIVSGEIQILENNNAADPDADLSASSAAWKAILPNQANNGYTLVAPGTQGTLHWNWLNSKITLDTVTSDFVGQKSTAFKDLAVDSTHVPYVPSIMQELGLFPLSGDQTQGMVYIDFADAERFPRRGGSCNNPSVAGLGSVYASHTRSYASTGYGVRSGFVE